MDTIIVHPNGPIKSKIRFYWAIGKIFIPVNVFEYDCRYPKYSREMLFEWEFHFMNSKKRYFAFFIRDAFITWLIGCSS